LRQKGAKPRDWYAKPENKDRVKAARSTPQMKAKIKHYKSSSYAKALKKNRESTPSFKAKRAAMDKKRNDRVEVKLRNKTRRSAPEFKEAERMRRGSPTQKKKKSVCGKLWYSKNTLRVKATQRARMATAEYKAWRREWDKKSYRQQKVLLADFEHFKFEQVVSAQEQ
jgi:hypothetical protein